MGNMLLIIGWRAPDATPSTALMNEVANKVQPTDRFFMRRCHTPSALPGIIEDVVARYGPIDVLDLYDHGGDGHQRMGDRQLFASAGDQTTPLIGEEFAVAIAPHLTATAHVRLLGCDTSSAVVPAPGRFLLVKLARTLGERRTVFGTMNVTDPDDFYEGGLKPGREPSLLFSSSAALDIEAPTPEERTAHILATRKPPA